MVKPRKILELFSVLVEEIKKFLQDKNPTLLTRNSTSAVMLLKYGWLLDLAFLYDVTQSFKNLCIKVQGCEQLLTALLNAVKAF